MATKQMIALLQALWMKAYAEEEVILRFGTKAELTTLRFKLYNVAKTAKNSLDISMAPLKLACEACVINILDEKTLAIRHGVLEPLMLKLAAQQGIDLDTLDGMDQISADARESERLLAGKLANLSAQVSRAAPTDPIFVDHDSAPLIPPQAVVGEEPPYVLSEEAQARLAAYKRRD